MKLAIVKMIGAVALQFTKAPHWVDFTHEGETGTVSFRSGNAPACTVTCEKKDKKEKLNVAITVPKNGGLNNVFGANARDDKQAGTVAKLIREAVEAYIAAEGAEAKIDVI